jgi:uroporphyrinogen decarboxylase
MKHRERVQISLNHETPDRCPLQVSFTPEFADRLRIDLNVKGRNVHNPHGGGNTYELERVIKEDMLLASVGWANSYYQQSGTYTDEWGITWKPVEYTTPYGIGHYTEPLGHPLADDEAVFGYKAPDPQRPELYDDAARLIRDFKTEYWIVGVTVTTIFECADFVLNPDLAEYILEIPYRYHLYAAKKLVEMGVDMIWLGDDVGAQSRLLISPQHWRKYLKPRMANFIAELKCINPHLKVAYHSDGFIYPIIPEIIEIGIDVLNPIQPASMDPAILKEKFGDRLCFWGTIDEQHTLPFGTPQAVRTEVNARLKTIGKNGGLIISPTHHVQLDTPMENFWAMVNSITETKYADLQ